MFHHGAKRKGFKDPPLERVLAEEWIAMKKKRDFDWNWEPLTEALIPHKKFRVGKDYYQSQNKETENRERLKKFS